MGDLDWDASPFTFEPEKHTGRGVLCLHGFTGTPFEVSYLGRALADQGFLTMGPLLTGHGLTAADLVATEWQDWYEAASRALDQLRARCDVVAVAGLSMGGLTTLHLARHRPKDIAAIVPMAAPLWLPPHVTFAVPQLARATRLLPSEYQRLLKGMSDVRDPVARARNPCLDSLPFAAVKKLLEYCEVVRSEIDLVTTPAFIAHGKQDHTAPFECSVELRARIGSRDVRFLALPDSYHLIPVDVERRRLAREVGQFLRERMM